MAQTRLVRFGDDPTRTLFHGERLRARAALAHVARSRAGQPRGAAQQRGLFPPMAHLVEGERGVLGAQFVDLHHCLAHRRRVLLECLHTRRVIKDAARHLGTVAARGSRQTAVGAVGFRPQGRRWRRTWQCERAPMSAGSRAAATGRRGETRESRRRDIDVRGRGDFMCTMITGRLGWNSYVRSYSVRRALYNCTAVKLLRSCRSRGEGKGRPPQRSPLATARGAWTARRR